MRKLNIGNANDCGFIQCYPIIYPIMKAAAVLLASYKQVAGKLKMAINPVLLRSTKRRSNHFREVTK